MAYTRNFGMRSFENIVRTGRFRVPASGTPLKIGSPVMIDPANPGRLKAAVVNADPIAGCGVLVYEHIQNKSDALTTVSDAPYDVVPLGQYAQMVHGPGAKVWFRLTADRTLYDGRTQTGYNPFAAAVSTFAPGDNLSPDASGKYVEGGTKPWFTVEQANATTGLVECRFLF